MIEDIKKELRILFMCYCITPCPDYSKKDTRTEIEIRGDIVTTIKLVNEVLDKYNNPEKLYTKEEVLYCFGEQCKICKRESNSYKEVPPTIITDDWGHTTVINHEMGQ
jgi:hypothetical protein